VARLGPRRAESSCAPSSWPKLVADALACSTRADAVTIQHAREQHRHAFPSMAGRRASWSTCTGFLDSLWEQARSGRRTITWQEGQSTRRSRSSWIHQDLSRNLHGGAEKWVQRTDEQSKRGRA
jgi:hypothetical protein